MAVIGMDFTQLMQLLERHGLGPGEIASRCGLPALTVAAALDPERAGALNAAETARVRRALRGLLPTDALEECERSLDALDRRISAGTSRSVRVPTRRPR